MSYFEHYLRRAAKGECILLIGRGFQTFSAHVNQGSLHIRGHGPNSLKSVAVNVVVFFGSVPEDIATLAIERMSGMLNTKLEILCSESLTEIVSNG